MRQMTFSDFEYSNRKKKTKKEEFLDYNFPKSSDYRKAL